MVIRKGLAYRFAKTLCILCGLTFLGAPLEGCAKFQRHSNIFFVATGEGAGPGRSERLEEGSITLYTREGEELGKFAYGGYQTFYLSEPAGYSCLVEVAGRREPLRAGQWQECTRRQGLWASGWIDRVASAEVALRGCPPFRATVHLKKMEDSRWEIWVPWRSLWSDTLSTQYLGTLWLGPKPCEFGLD